ncbi:MAG: hypothetical protein ACTSWN_06040 [Promethearchaeota archaeon]
MRKKIAANILETKVPCKICLLVKKRGRSIFPFAGCRNRFGYSTLYDIGEIEG